jgi:hypothetical protein
VKWPPKSATRAAVSSLPCRGGTRQTHKSHRKLQKQPTCASEVGPQDGTTQAADPSKCEMKQMQTSTAKDQLYKQLTGPSWQPRALCRKCAARCQALESRWHPSHSPCSGRSQLPAQVQTPPPAPL